MKYKMIVGVNELRRNIEINHEKTFLHNGSDFEISSRHSHVAKYSIKELKVTGEKLISILKSVLPNAMEDVSDPDIRGKSPNKYILNLATNKLGDFSQRIILTYEEERSIVGILIALPNQDKESYNIFTIGVYKEYRGKGIGKALLHTLARVMMRNNINKVTLDVHSQNIDAIRLYCSIGFKKINNDNG